MQTISVATETFKLARMKQRADNSLAEQESRQSTHHPIVLLSAGEHCVSLQADNPAG